MLSVLHATPCSFAMSHVLLTACSPKDRQQFVRVVAHTGNSADCMLFTPLPPPQPPPHNPSPPLTSPQPPSEQGTPLIIPRSPINHAYWHRLCFWFLPYSFPADCVRVGVCAGHRQRPRSKQTLSVFCEASWQLCHVKHAADCLCIHQNSQQFVRLAVQFDDAADCACVQDTGRSHEGS